MNASGTFRTTLAGWAVSKTRKPASSFLPGSPLSINVNITVYPYVLSNRPVPVPSILLTGAGGGFGIPGFVQTAAVKAVMWNWWVPPASDQLVQITIDFETLGHRDNTHCDLFSAASEATLSGSTVCWDSESYHIGRSIACRVKTVAPIGGGVRRHIDCNGI